MSFCNIKNVICFLFEALRYFLISDLFPKWKLCCCFSSFNLNLRISYYCNGRYSHISYLSLATDRLGMLKISWSQLISV
jgi:hypothetical protein